MGYTVKKIGNNGTIKLDTTLLDALIKGTEIKYVVRVGILGATGRNRLVRKSDESKAAFRKRVRQFLKSAKKESDVQTNAEIGLAHEKGVKSKNLPRRSWLEEPLKDHLSEYFEKLGKKAIENMLYSEYKEAYSKLGIICEAIIQKGFASDGYGKWQKLSQSTIAKKGSAAILIDSGQLRKSVTSEVVSS